MPRRGGRVPVQPEVKHSYVTQVRARIKPAFVRQAKNIPRPEKKPGGKGNIDWNQLERAKEILRIRHPCGVRIIEVAKHVGCSRLRAARLLDLLSEGTDFLVYMDDDINPVQFFIFKDVEVLT